MGSSSGYSQPLLLLLLILLAFPDTDGNFPFTWTTERIRGSASEALLLIPRSGKKLNRLFFAKAKKSNAILHRSSSSLEIILHEVTLVNYFIWSYFKLHETLVQTIIEAIVYNANKRRQLSRKKSFNSYFKTMLFSSKSKKKQTNRSSIQKNWSLNENVWRTKVVASSSGSKGPIRKLGKGGHSMWGIERILKLIFRLSKLSFGFLNWLEEGEVRVLKYRTTSSYLPALTGGGMRLKWERKQRTQLGFYCWWEDLRWWKQGTLGRRGVKFLLIQDTLEHGW